MSGIRKIKIEEFPHIKKTKIMLMNGLMELLTVKSISEISIKDLAAYSQVGRKTFYRHYSCKEDVIREYIQILIKDYLEEFPNYYEPSMYNMSIKYFEYWQNHNTIIKILDKNSLFILLLEEYTKIVKWYEETYTDASVIRLTGESEITTDYFNAYNMAGLWYVLILWLKNGMKEPIEDMARLCNRIIGSQI